MGIAVTYHSVDGASGALFHLFNHGMMKGLAFLSAGVFLWALHTGRGSHHPLTIKDLAGGARRYPLAAFALSVALLGLGGLPPFSGFMSKWQIFVAGFRTGDGWIIALVIFAALNSLLSLGYYAPLVNMLYRQEPSEAVQKGLPIGLSFQLPSLVLVLVTIALGVWPSLLSWLISPGAYTLLAAFGG